MKTKQTEQESFHIGQEQLLAFVGAMIGGNRRRHDDDSALQPGPWDPVVRVALERLEVRGPSPEPWRVVLASILTRHPEAFDAIPGGHNLGEIVALNPQPLPPRLAFLVTVAQAVISRAELLQEMSDASSREVERPGVIAGGYISRFSDDWCGTGFRLRYPFPEPRPQWFTQELDGIDLMVMATQFEQSAKEAFSANLRETLANASAKFVEAACSKIQNVQ